jgi:phage-related protein
LPIGSLSVDLQLDTGDMVAALQESTKRLAEIGAQATRQMKIVKAEFGEASAKIDDSADSVDNLQTKYDYLGKRLDQQKLLVAALADTYQKSVQVTGENSAETQRLELRLARAREEEARTEQQIRQTNSRLEEQRRATQEAGRDWAAMGEELKGFGEKMSIVSVAITGGMALAVEGTEEWRNEMAILETNAKITGESIDNVNEVYKTLFSFRDDLGANNEALSAMMNMGFSGKGLQQIAEDIIGASIKFKDTLNPEGLAADMQESLATGQTTGMFDEMLSRLGVNLDDFNAGLAEAKANGTELDYVLQQMASLGLSSVYDEFVKANPELIKSRDATYDMKSAMAELGETLLPIMTKFNEAVATLVGLFNKVPEPIQNIILVFGTLVVALGPVLFGIGQILSLLGGGAGIAAAIGKVTALLPTLSTAFTTALGAILSPAGLVVAAIAAIGFVAYEIIKNWEPIKEFFRDTWESIKSGVNNTVQYLKNAWNGFTGFFKGIWNGYWSYIKSVLNLIISGFNVLISGLNKIRITVPDWSPIGAGRSWGVNIGKIPTLHTGGIYNAPSGQTEGLALLEDGERVIAKGQTSSQVIQHTGTITVRGVNDQNQLIGVVDIVMNQLRKEMRT